MNDHAELAQKFIDSFEAVAVNLNFFEHLDAIATQLAVGPKDDYGQRQWRPIKVQIDPTALNPVYARLPARFPPLYEQLILSYRWARVDLKTFMLLENPPGEGLEGLLSVIMRDNGIWTELIKNGYIQLGRGSDMDYDPVCFDINSRNNRDYRIVKIDHEEILCNNRIKVVSEIAPSFRALALQTIERAAAVRRS